MLFIDLDMLGSYLSSEITYFPAGVYYDADTKYITRAEWVHTLVEGFDMSIEDESTIINYYSDLDDNEYVNDIAIALNFGVFDFIDEEFHPDEYVTRDFASHTLNFCLGYSNDVSLTVSDAENIYYAGDAQVAVNSGWFETYDSCFCPSMFVTSYESEKAFKDMYDAIESTKIDENYENKIIYNKDVVIIDDATNISMSGNEVIIEGSNVSLNDGDNFVFQLDGIEVIRKVSYYNWVGDDSFAVITEDVDENAIVSADLMGYAYVDYDNIEVLSDEIDVELTNDVAENQNMRQSRASGTIDLKNTKISLSGKVPLENGAEMSLSGEIKNIKIPYSINCSGLIVNNLYLAFDCDAKIEGKYSAKSESKPSLKSKQIDLARIPVVGTAGLGVNVVVSAFVSVSGEISLSYSFDVESGIEYSKDSGWRTVKNFNGKSFTLSTKVEAKIGLKAAAAFTLFGKDIGELYVQGGVKQPAFSPSVSKADTWNDR